MPQRVCCRSFGDYTNEVVQREKCTSRYKAARVQPRTELKKREGRERKVKKFCSAIARIADNIFFAESPVPRRMGFPSTRFRLNPSRTEPAFIETLLPSILSCTCFYTHLSRKSPFQPMDDVSVIVYWTTDGIFYIYRNNHLFSRV